LILRVRRWRRARLRRARFGRVETWCRPITRGVLTSLLIARNPCNSPGLSCVAPRLHGADVTRARERRMRGLQRLRRVLYHGGRVNGYQRLAGEAVAGAEGPPWRGMGCRVTWVKLRVVGGDDARCNLLEFRETCSDLFLQILNTTFKKDRSITSSLRQPAPPTTPSASPTPASGFPRASRSQAWQQPPSTV